MKKIFLVLLIVMVAASASFGAYQSDIQILSSEQIAAISDDVLLENYIDVCVEIQAADVFHAAPGFTPEEYRSYKDLLRYRIFLINEIKHRKLEVPQTE